MQEGDALWLCASPEEDWQHLCGRGGIALVRGHLIALECPTFDWIRVRAQAILSPMEQRDRTRACWIATESWLRCQMVVDDIRRSLKLSKNGWRYASPVTFRARLHEALQAQWRGTHAEERAWS